MGLERRMASQSGGLLGAHFGIGEGLHVGAAPRMEVHGARVLGVLEELALTLSERSGSYPNLASHLAAVLANRRHGFEGFDTKRPAQVAPKRIGMAHARLAPLACLVSS